MVQTAISESYVFHDNTNMRYSHPPQADIVGPCQVQQELLAVNKIKELI